MNMEDEDEYLDMYDFSKTYENHPLLIKEEPTLAITQEESAKKETDDEVEDGWEDCDVEDGTAAPDNKGAEV